VGITSLEVPLGLPDISFAAFSPRGRLWVGLRYVDRDQDIRDFGAAEVSVDDGKVIYHRQKPKGATSNASEGVAIPSDVTAISFKSADEIWFASRSGAVRLLDNKVKVFTENDGLESELLHDVVEGTNGQIWVATTKGIGSFDGTKWTFPQSGHLNRKSRALARDPEGRVWVGGDQGVMEIVDENKRHFIGTRTGLLDDRVLNLGIDLRGRVWTLTEKGISIIEPL
jgi:ligand-binding sensor domain-containing protein